MRAKVRREDERDLPRGGKHFIKSQVKQHTTYNESHRKTITMDTETAILSALLSDLSISDSYEFATTNSIDHNTVVGISKSLEADAYVSLAELSTQFYVLSKEAESILERGSQEILVIRALLAAGESGLSVAELQEKVGKDACKIGMGNCLKNKWAKKEKDGRLVAAVGGEEVKDDVREMLGRLKEGGGGADVLDDKVSVFIVL